MPHKDESVYDFWTRVPAIHRELTRHQWDILRRHAEGQTNTVIAEALGRTPRAIGGTLKRAGKHIFEGTPFVPDASALGAWYGQHRPCCDHAAEQAAREQSAGLLGEAQTPP